jgi:hypothetical protein
MINYLKKALWLEFTNSDLSRIASLRRAEERVFSSQLSTEIHTADDGHFTLFDCYTFLVAALQKYDMARDSLTYIQPQAD